LTRFNPPAGFKPYGGATKGSLADATGAIYWWMSTRYPDGRFGTAVFRQNANEQAVWLGDLPVFVEGRGTLTPDGFLTANAAGDVVYRQRVPGFVAWGSAVGSQTAPITPPAPMPVSVVDNTARELAAQAKDDAKKALKAAGAAGEVAAAAQTTADSKPSLADVKAAAQAALLAAIEYARSTPAGSKLALLIWDKAKDSAYALLVERGIVQD
jgi:hypothetical protein